MVEGYGPGGAAVMARCVTRDAGRAADDVRRTLARHGGSLGAAGSVAYLFNEVGVLRFPAAAGHDRVQAAALEAGAEDVVPGRDDAIDVLTDPRDFPRVRDALARAGLVPAGAVVTRRSAVSVPLAGEDAARMAGLLAALAALDGVQDVYSNAELPAAVTAQP